MSKKLIALILLFILAFTACCAPQADVTEPSAEEVPYQPLEPERAEETRGVWISYIEITENCSSEEKLSSFMEGMLTDFERIGDHATNIAEGVEFSVTGIHKGGK